jgi:hypothetical protein
MIVTQSQASGRDRLPSASRRLNLAVGFNPQRRVIFLLVASATIEFSRRSRDAGTFADRSVG